MAHLRQDIQIPSDGELMAAWLYPAAGPTASTSPSNPGPAIVLAHGLGAVKEMRLDAYSELFSAAGYTCVAFDYRFSGASTGKPVGLVNVDRQLDDWAVAIEYVRSLPNVDPKRVGIFGSSFGGGNVIRVAARDPSIKAIISQCPFTDGFHSAMTTGLFVLPALLWLGIKDYLFGSNENPITVPLVGVPGEAALMNTIDARSGCEALIPNGYVHPNAIPARFILQIPLMRPGAYAASVQSPIFFAICGKDSVAPPGPTLKYAKKAPNATIRYYDDLGHFDIYLGYPFDKVSKEYLTFLRKHLPVE